MIFLFWHGATCHFVQLTHLTGMCSFNVTRAHTQRYHASIPKCLFSSVLVVPRIADETCWQEQLLSDPCFSESWASVQESRADADVEPLPQSGVLKSWAERWDSKEAFKTLGHFETLSSRPDPKNVRSIGLPWFAAWNCEAEIAVGSIWAASAGCSWDPVPGTEVPQMQMPWVQLWSSYGQRINRTCLYRVKTRT